MIHLCVTPGRERKTGWMMAALAQGIDCRTRTVHGAPPDDDASFVVWGQKYLAEEILPAAIRTGRPFWHIDNGYWNPGRGQQSGNYRITYRSLSPILMDQPDPRRAASVGLRPWREAGEHVLIGMPGHSFGSALGLDMKSWCAGIEARVREKTGRPVRIREKGSRRPLQHDLDGAWCVVSHSSNIAVDAVLAGVPVIVERTSPASPMSGTLDDVEGVPTPDRTHWIASLACQQFTMAEMANGTAWRFIQMVQRQVEG